MRRVWIALAGLAMLAGMPLAALADNQQIAEQIAAHLRNSGQLHGYKIAVKFQDGTAWLRGRVSSEEQMRLALQLAAQVPGVQRVENELTVVQPERASTCSLEPPAARQGMPMRAQAASAQIPAPVLQQGAAAIGPEQTPRPWAVRSLPPAEAQPTSAPVKNLVQRLMPASEGIARVAGVQTGPVITSPDQLSLDSKYVGYDEPAGSPAPLQPIPMAQSVPRPLPTAPTASRSPARPMPVAMAPSGQGSVPAGPVPTQPLPGSPVPVAGAPVSGALAPVRYDQPHLPNYAWPSYAAYPNYAAVTYPKQYSPTAWPYIGPFYPYPQVPLGWRKVTLQWHDGWWWLDFDDGVAAKPFNGLFRLK